MAHDRFVYFNDRMPSHADVALILSNYFGGCGTITEPQKACWMVVLPGTARSPFDGLPDGHRHTTFGNDQRWIEVTLSLTTLDVLTRAQDEFTNGIADQLARAFARFYQARLEDD